MRHKLENLWRFFYKYLDRPWYIIFVMAMAAADLFVAFIPTELLLVMAVLARPARWVSAALLVTLGSAIGAYALGWLVDRGGAPVVEWFIPNAFQTEIWRKAATFLEDYGASSIGLVALSPIPQQPVVLMGALTQMPLWKIFLGVFVGRGVKYLFFAWAATHAPKLMGHWFKKIPTEAHLPTNVS